MKIRFNNFFKFKTKEKNIVEKSNKTVKEPMLKVYSGGGQVIKYEPYKMSERYVEEVGRRRKGAANVGRFFDSGGSKQDTPVKKYSDKVSSRVVEQYENRSEEEDKTEEKRKPKRRQRGGNRSAYLLFLFMLILAGYSLSFSYNKYKDLNEEDYAVYNSEDVEEKIVMPEEQSSVSNNLDATYTEEIVKTSTSVSTNSSATKTQAQKVVPLEFAKPIEGEILKIYSSDKVIYSKTLELWKTHDGIDIKADKNTIVKAIEKGTVEKIYDDSFYGKTIVIDHGQGYKSSYSNLSEEVFVKEKQVVTKLAKIGKVGTTAIGEIKDEPHLHFTLIKNNEICDPSSIFY